MSKKIFSIDQNVQLEQLVFSFSDLIGVDEAGRGCLAGPVVAAAVLFSPDGPRRYRDSKTLSAKRRAALSDEIKQHHIYGIGFASVEEITKINILWAALLAMNRAVKTVLEKAEGVVLPQYILVDGNQIIPKLPESIPQAAVIKGDDRVAQIAAASILAKVARDNWVIEAAKDYPGYGLESHKGYSTKLHKDSIAQLGVTPIHRPTFAGVKEHL